jgi:hypothetical protein
MSHHWATSTIDFYFKNKLEIITLFENYIFFDDMSEENSEGLMLAPITLEKNKCRFEKNGYLEEIFLRGDILTTSDKLWRPYIEKMSGLNITLGNIIEGDEDLEDEYWDFCSRTREENNPIRENELDLCLKVADLEIGSMNFCFTESMSNMSVDYGGITQIKGIVSKPETGHLNLSLKCTFGGFAAYLDELVFPKIDRINDKLFDRRETEYCISPIAEDDPSEIKPVLRIVETLILDDGRQIYQIDDFLNLGDLDTDQIPKSRDEVLALLQPICEYGGTHE